MRLGVLTNVQTASSTGSDRLLSEWQLSPGRTLAFDTNPSSGVGIDTAVSSY